MDLAIAIAITDVDGRGYINDLIQNTDFQKFDDTLRMVLDLSEEQVTKLETYLEQHYQSGALYYGLHKADSALVTCLIFHHAGHHIHFIDGGNGGYALAARQMKAQMKIKRPKS